MERCDHRDGYGSAIWSSRQCILCGREVPLTVRQAWRQFVHTLKAALRR